MSGNVSVDLDQCRNGSADAPVPCDHSTGPDGWENGNANFTHAHYAENQFVPYRLRIGGLSEGTHTIIIRYDYIKVTGNDTDHAFDYLGSYNYTETTANPCVGIKDGDPPICDWGSPTSTLPIDQDTLLVTSKINPNTGTNIVQLPGAFTMWGGTLMSMEYLPLDANHIGERDVKVTFEVDHSNADVVLAWGGHLAWMGDWGFGNSASDINGSPYHMALDQVDDDGGRHAQDRDLKLTFSTGLVIIKKVVNTQDGTGASSQAFPFTATANFGPVSFSLTDNIPGAGGVMQMSQPIINFGSGNTNITVTEGSVPNWTLLNVNCVESGTQDSTKNGLGPASIVAQPGELVVCTFTNSNLRPTAAPASIAGRVLTNSGMAIRGAMLTLTDLTTGESRTILTNNFGYYTFNNVQTDGVYGITVSSKSYRFANSSRTISLLDNLAGLDFVGTAAATQPTMAPPNGRSVVGVGRPGRSDQ